MDPSEQDQTQPAQAPQQPAVTPEQPKAERPALNTPISVPSPEQRPVGTWAPATEATENPTVVAEQTPAPSTNLEPMISSFATKDPNQELDTAPAEVQQVGQELAGLSLNQASTQPAQNLELSERTETLGPVASPTSELFQQETLNQNLPKSSKLKKVLLSILGCSLFVALFLGVYIFIFGNKVVENYRTSSSITIYQSAFQEISSALEKTPADKAKLESGFNKLKIAESNHGQLSNLFLGNLNPNYKKAKEMGGAISEYHANTKKFQENYAFVSFLTALSNVDLSLNAISELNKTDFSKVPVETFSTNLENATQNCKDLITSLKEAAKPADLSLASGAFTSALAATCEELPKTVQSVTDGKTGLLGTEDQEKLKAILTATSNNISSIINGSNISSFYINQLTSYSRAAKDESAKFQKEAEALLAD